jgi:hypothetical protein
MVYHDHDGVVSIVFGKISDKVGCYKFERSGCHCLYGRQWWHCWVGVHLHLLEFRTSFYEVLDEYGHPWPPVVLATGVQPPTVDGDDGDEIPNLAEVEGEDDDDDLDEYLLVVEVSEVEALDL